MNWAGGISPYKQLTVYGLGWFPVSGSSSFIVPSYPYLGRTCTGDSIVTVVANILQWLYRCCYYYFSVTLLLLLLMFFSDSITIVVDIFGDSTVAAVVFGFCDSIVTIINVLQWLYCYCCCKMYDPLSLASKILQWDHKYVPPYQARLYLTIPSLVSEETLRFNFDCPSSLGYHLF